MASELPNNEPLQAAIGIRQLMFSACMLGRLALTDVAKP
jgi:hypothetical protein